MEDHIPNLYSPEGFYQIFKEGFLPVPYLADPNKKYSKATMWKTAMKDGGVKVVDDLGNVIDTPKRYYKIIDGLNL